MSRNRNRHQNQNVEAQVEDQTVSSNESNETVVSTVNNEESETKVEDEPQVETKVEDQPEVVEETKTEEPVAEAIKEPTLEELMNQFKSKSAVMRYLHSIGWKRSKIAKFMDVRYQFVRNVLIQPVKEQAPAVQQTVTA